MCRWLGNFFYINYQLGAHRKRCDIFSTMPASRMRCMELGGFLLPRLLTNNVLVSSSSSSSSLPSSPSEKKGEISQELLHGSSRTPSGHPDRSRYATYAATWLLGWWAAFVWRPPIKNWIWPRYNSIHTWSWLTGISKPGVLQDF